MKLIMKVQISCSPEQLWRGLTSRETFLTVSAPLMKYQWAEGEAVPSYWSKGIVLNLKLRFFGALPLGKHTIRFEEVDAGRKVLQTVETGLLIPCWKHRMEVFQGDYKNESRLQETLVIQSGWRTIPLYSMASAFFKYRHYRLRKLLPLLHSKS